MVLSINNRGSTTFADFNNVVRWAKALKTIASLSVRSSGVAGVSLASSSSYSYLILALTAVSFAWEVKTLIVSLSKVFAGPATALPAAVFHGIV